MPKIERLEFPKKYPLKYNWIVLVLISVVIGVLVHNCTQKQVRETIIISDIAIADYSDQYINVIYTIKNLQKEPQEIRLLAKVYDKDGGEIASTLFIAKLKPLSNQVRTKLIDSLNRSLKPGEKPYRVTITLYERKLI
ncbi:MAG: hypothetical protein CVU48_05390 [Candidatus Cloacimonetes bacterium HGW-Cloacimonetes-1]|jgi:hypothetical protein|nr:MAG: hypothetical protein CVU48_05390 [Candidatus Cloacimonetes bacterium HGW-Cloacimonetes-1]